MTRSLPTLFLALAVLIGACSGSPTEAPRPSVGSTAAPTTTTTEPTTTTTAPSIEIEGASRGVTVLVRDFYAYASGESTDRPPAPEEVLAAISPGEIDLTYRGSAETGVFDEQRLAVVEVGSDVFLAVDDESGWRIVGGEWPSLSVPPYFGETPRHVAVVGSDARPGQDVDGSRADSIHFVALDGEGGGAVVGLPRDSWVTAPGIGRTKITNSLALGGPDALMGAFTELTGLPFEGYVLTGFSGFEALLGSVLGGVAVEVPFAINDRWAHVSLQAGTQMLDGAQALGFARARKTVPGGDFTRSEHQGMILLASAESVRSMGVGSIPGLLERSEPHIITDLSAEQLFTFSAMAINSDLDDMPNIVAPGSPGRAGRASVVFLSGSVDELWADLADGRLED
ncbi:MAG: LCP family protein [Actinomycetota bacterium]